MRDLADTSKDTRAPHETGALIDHILTRYHDVHRAELAELQPMARKVETVHADNLEVPAGLTQAFGVLASGMQDHMAKEEMLLFPAVRAGSDPGIKHPIAVMRADHVDHAENIALIRRLTDDLTPPVQACGSLRALYARTEQLLDDLVARFE